MNFCSRINVFITTRPLRQESAATADVVLFETAAEEQCDSVSPKAKRRWIGEAKKNSASLCEDNPARSPGVKRWRKLECQWDEWYVAANSRVQCQTEVGNVGGLIPLTDASRRPVRLPIVTICIIVTNFLVFVLELNGGEAFVLKWAAIPANITSGHNWVTILTAMFMHGSWSHILGNMVFLWAFGPEMEDAMNPLRYLAFYLSGGLVVMLTQVALSPYSTVPNLGASGLSPRLWADFW